MLVLPKELPVIYLIFPSIREISSSSLCCLFYVLHWNALYVKNMLIVESSAIGEIIGSTLLMMVVDRLIEIDVRIFLTETQYALLIFLTSKICVF